MYYRIIRKNYKHYNEKRIFYLRRGSNMKKQYGIGSLLLDLFLIWITGGLWLLVLLVKFLRS